MRDIKEALSIVIVPVKLVAAVICLPETKKARL